MPATARRMALVALALVATQDVVCAQQTIDIDQIGEVCSGLEVIQASGGRGTISSKGFQFDVGRGDHLVIKRSGKILKVITNFTGADYVTCVTQLASILNAAPPSRKSR